MQEPTFSVSTFPFISNESIYNTSSSSLPNPEPPSPSASPSTSTSPSIPVACAATSSKFVLLGLQDGTLSLYDVFGNLLDTHANLHSTSLTAIALSSDSIIATSSASADVRVARLSNTHQNMLSAATLAFTRNVDTPVVSLAIDPYFGKPRYGDRVVYVDTLGRVVLYTSGWFGGSDVVIATQTPKALGQSVAWVGNLIAFPTGEGVQVYDARNSKLVCRVAPPGVNQPASPMMKLSPGKTLEQQPPFSNTTIPTPPEIDAQKKLPTSITEANKNDKDIIISSNGKRKRWAKHTRIYMDIDEKVPVSPQGEPAVRLYLTWPNGARIIRVSPQPSPSPNSLPSAPLPAREIDVIFKLERNALITPSLDRPLMGGTLSAIRKHENGDEEDESPLLSVVPFGNDECVALIGLPKAGAVALHLISPEGHSLKHMILPYRGVHDANVLTVPGGDPLVLIVAHPDEDGEMKRGVKIDKKKGKQQSENESSKHQTEEDKKDTVISSHSQGYGAVTSASTSTSTAPEVESETKKNARASQVLYVRSLTTAERVKWLLSEDRFLDALSVAQSAPGGSLRRAEVSLVDIGEQYLDSLREIGDYDRLASVLPETIATTSPFTGFRSRDRIMAKRRKRWDIWIGIFQGAGHLATVAKVIPTYEPLLEQKIYSGILTELAATNPDVMVSVLKTWPADVFDVSAVTKAIEKELLLNVDVDVDHENDPDQKNEVRKIDWNEKEKEALNEGLLMLYALSGRHDETLLFLLRDKSARVFDYIQSHNLYEAVRSADTITGLYSIDPVTATDVLSHAPETVLPPDAVVPILNKVNNPKWTYMYLHATFRIDPEQAPKYHNTLLKLYVMYGPPGTLYNFLKTSTHYSLDVALDAMHGAEGDERGHLAKERVFVLSAMGDLSSAMDILLNELGDTFAAIEFATDHGDQGLWERLIEHAKTNADTLAALLDSPAGGKVDPVRLVPLLKSEMRIPNLRDRLHRILVDAALERALREDAAAALHHDAGQLLRKLDSSVYGLPS